MPQAQIIVPLDTERAVVLGMNFGRQVFERQIAQIAPLNSGPDWRGKFLFKMIVDF